MDFRCFRGFGVLVVSGSCFGGIRGFRCLGFGGAGVRLQGSGFPGYS